MVFKNDLPISSHRPNTCTTCGVFFDSTTTLCVCISWMTNRMRHRDYRGHVNNGRLKKRVCYCSLCSKQFTSGQQLAEHVRSSLLTETVVEGQGAQGALAVRIGKAGAVQAIKRRLQRRAGKTTSIVTVCLTSIQNQMSKVAVAKKLNILCLHGYFQDAAIMRERTPALRRKLKSIADFCSHFSPPSLPRLPGRPYHGQLNGWI